MKILKVLTSHDQVGNTGLKPASGWKRVPLPASLSGTPGPFESRLTQRRAATDRSVERSAAESDARPARFKKDGEAQKPSLTPSG